jgi:hypothetical protein
VKEVTAAVVREITVAADETEGAVKGMGTAEATEIVAAKTAVPAQVMGIAAVIRAAEMPEAVARGMREPEVAPAKGLGTTAAAVVGAPDVAAKLAEALELAIIRVPGIVAEPAKSMEAEAALVP